MIKIAPNNGWGTDTETLHSLWISHSLERHSSIC